MNGYKMLADSYKQLLERIEPDTDTDNINSNIKVLEFLATCTDTDICNLFNSTAFNSITKAYCKRAMLNNGYNTDETQSVITELDSLFSVIQAKEILQ